MPRGWHCSCTTKGMAPTRSNRATMVACALSALALCTSSAEGQPAAETHLLERLSAWSTSPVVPHRARRRLEAHKVGSHERAWLVVQTSLDPAKGFFYEVVAEGGPHALRHRMKQVLDEEQRVWRSGEPQHGALSAANYHLAVIGSQDDEVRVRIVPRKRARFLLDGVATLDRGTGEVRRVEGELAKPPSFWIKDVRLTRRYTRVGSRVMPASLESIARVRIWGVYYFTMTYDYESVEGVPVARLARR